MVSTDARLNGYFYLPYIDPGLPVKLCSVTKSQTCDITMISIFGDKLLTLHCSRPAGYTMLIPACQLNYALSYAPYHLIWLAILFSFLCITFIWIWCLPWFCCFAWIQLASCFLGFYLLARTFNVLTWLVDLARSRG